MKIVYSCLVVVASAACLMAAPIEDDISKERGGRALSFYDYVQQPNDGLADYEELDSEDYALAFGYGTEEIPAQDDLSRTLPQNKQRKKTRRPFNSPIYYIRLPPQPYMFVPGYGYIPQPMPSPQQQFLNVPVSFVANGKPANIYQWSAIQPPGMATAPTPPPPTTTTTPRPKPNSTVHRLHGQFPFNGKPDDIFVLRDSYNSLYGDSVLQHFYP